MAKWQDVGVARWVLTAMMGLVAVGLLSVQPAVAGDLEELDSALKLVPRNVAFYSSCLRGREQVEAIAKSRAWSKIWSMPAVQDLREQFDSQAAEPGSGPSQVQAALNDPQIATVIATLADMFSSEVFVAGDKNFVHLVELAQVVASTMRYGPILLEVTGNAGELEKDEVQAALLLNAVIENVDLIKIPNVIVGFKLSDTNRALQQLAKLELMAGAILGANPDLADRFKRTKVGEYDYLVLSLDGEMIPWDEVVPLEDLQKLEAEEGDVEELLAKLKELELVIALGIREDYLLLSIGSSTDALANLDKGEKLVSRPELKPLAEFTDKRLTSINYVSKAMNTRLSSNKADIDDMLEVVHELLPLAELESEQEERIRKDAAALAGDLKQMVPDVGAVMTFSFLTEGGQESYSYDWGEHTRLDGSKPLGLLSHVGGNPLVAIVARGKHTPEDYDLLAKWAEVGYGYFQEFVVPQMPEDEREKLDKFVELAAPLVDRLDNANRTMLIPALADGQMGLVVDAGLKSKHFIESLPATEEAMPMVEPALIVGVSDAKLLEKAVDEYRQIIQKVLEAFRQVEPGKIPEDFKLPEAQLSETEVGKIYSYVPPEECGVDKSIVPNVGLSEKVAVLSISPKQTERLLKATPLECGGALAEADQPMTMAGCLNFAALLEAATPWIDLAAEMILKEQMDLSEDSSDEEKAKAEAIKQQVHTVLEVLKCLRTVTSKTTLEDGAMVTRTITEIRDVE